MQFPGVQFLAAANYQQIFVSPRAAVLRGDNKEPFGEQQTVAATRAASSAAAAQYQRELQRKPEKGAYYDSGGTRSSQRHLADKSSPPLVLVELQQLLTKAVSSGAKRCDCKDQPGSVHASVKRQFSRQLSVQHPGAAAAVVVDLTLNSVDSQVILFILHYILSALKNICIFF